MDCLRLLQLIYMFASISNKTHNESRDLIMSTETGKAVQADDVTVMYEQETENLYSIVKELKESEFDAEIVNKFTIEAIVESLERIDEQDFMQIFVVPKEKNLGLKEMNQEQLKQCQKQKLVKKQRNYTNVRRTENAYKFEREK